MPLFHWGQGWPPFPDFERHVERLLANVRLAVPTLRVDRPYPPVNLWEDEQTYLLVAAVPGISPESLDLTITDGVLTLRGERLRPEGASDESFRRHERLWGTWERSLSLPERIQSDRITAEVADGVLKIRIPKSQESTPRQIPVTSMNDALPTSVTPASQVPQERGNSVGERAIGSGNSTRTAGPTITIQGS